jgi:hypothetical protein
MLDGRYDLVLQARGPLRQLDRSEEPPSADLEFAPGLFVTTLPHGSAELVFELCTPRDLIERKVETLPRTWTQRYALQRRRGDEGLDWDLAGELQCAIALSRLVQPTPICLEYAATIRVAGGTVTCVTPANPVGVGRGAWVSDPAARDFLTEAEWRLVGALVRASPFTTQGERWRRAMRLLEYAFRTFDGMVRWTLLATALEALVHTSRKNSTQQFVERTVALARRLRIDRWDRACAELAYAVRSGLAHGQSVKHVGEEDERRVGSLMEHLLRGVLLTAILDPGVGGMLQRENEIEVLGRATG